ncbi:RsmB/NOP family class I SAM-dependent RNA methyltransferase [Natronomonas sp. F2-12]|jgi:NOL1/NOP2/sun family putative RNA methylase|uniref:RsmB/NOP family class I SAM-dependent RNA methyltransferase n=1 Tax=Natronomonas aquatica TaxID=2841590 RepID=A0A9R1D4S8_9EURY|nr:RsmB/NOP family class I SAM-dependent RNA methyltransferase [Natronomonas aquatica]MCQ4332291.1 RsmB/NOP family class I SAM-dependent RNA methyltransferase [Natronomonas aquatica]
MDPLSRYDPLADDPAAFHAACERPLPSVVRVNGIKATPERVRRAFEAAGVEFEPVGWHEGLFRLGEGESPGNSWPFVHGWIYGQEEVSAVPALALDPQPGERVLDCCAAPGSKTTQLAARMEDRGLLVGNDNNLGRLSALRSNAERCGVSNLVVTRADARNFSLKPFSGERFDRTLVDVPCSCEGTVRKNPEAVESWSLDHVEGIAGVQRGILARSIEVTRPGGTVVYSTCTFAPEENEAVLQHALEEYDCRLVEFELPLESVPGITEWNGETFEDSMRRAKRIYPHHNDTGGFFCAKLEVAG